MRQKKFQLKIFYHRYLIYLVYFFFKKCEVLDLRLFLLTIEIQKKTIKMMSEFNKI